MRFPTPLWAALLLPAVLLFTACSPSPTEPSQSAVVELNAREYAATRVNPTSTIPQYEVSVVIRIRNTGAKPLYLGTCGESQTLVYGVELVRPSNEEGSAYDGIWACTGGQHLVVAAGAERTDTLRLRAPNGVQSGRVLGALSGTMRLVFAATTCQTPDECRGSLEVPLRSDEFTITLP